MVIALCSDEWLPIHTYVEKWLLQQGTKLVKFGAFKSHKEESWVESTQEASRAVSIGTCDQGIFFCWSGTGTTIAANKLKGIRAALCWDVETVTLAKIWNHANILVLPNRLLLTQELVSSLLSTWFELYDVSIGIKEVKKLQNIYHS